MGRCAIASSGPISISRTRTSIAAHRKEYRFLFARIEPHVKRAGQAGQPTASASCSGSVTAADCLYDLSLPTSWMHSDRARWRAHIRASIAGAEPEELSPTCNINGDGHTRGAIRPRDRQVIRHPIDEIGGVKHLVGDSVDAIPIETQIRAKPLAADRKSTRLNSS